MSNVYVIELSNKYQFERIEYSTFVPLLTESQRDSLVYYMKKKVSGLFNGGTVRLNGIHTTPSNSMVLEIYPLTYFDSLTTNMLYGNYKNKLSQLDLTKQEDAWIHQIVSNINESNISSVEDILSNTHLANTLGVSVLVKDITGRYCMVLRNKDLAVGAGLLSVTVTGAIDGTDYKNEDPIISCAQRELKEELGLEDCTLTPRYIAFSKNKLQPICIIDGKIDKK